MTINKTGTARLYIGGEYVADVNINNMDVAKEAIEQYYEDENLGRLLYHLDGVKVKEAEATISIGLTGYDIVELEKSIGGMAAYNPRCFKEAIYYNENHFAKYAGHRNGRHGIKKYPIHKKNY